MRVLEDAGTIERFEPSPAGVRLVYCGPGRRRTSTRRSPSSPSAGSRTPTGSISPPPGWRPTRAATSRWTPSSARPRRASTPPETYRAPDGRARGRARGLPRRDQRNPRAHRCPSRGGQPARQLHRPRIRLRRAHRGGRPRDHDVVVGTERFDSLPRPIIDGRPTGFCKLVADGRTTPSSAVTSSVNGPSSSPNSRRSRSRPA